MTVELLIDALATYRGTRLVVEDQITEKVRNKIWDHHPPDKGIGYLITCPYCASIWVGGAITIAKWAAPGLSKPLRYGLALSAVTCMYEDWRNR